MARLAIAAVAVAVAVAVVGLAPAAAAQDAQDAQDTDPPGGFSDVTEGVHKPGIDALNALGVFNGTECAKEMFCPGEEMKRSTMAVWLVRILDDEEPPAAAESSFADVDADEWWLPHAERLATLKVTSGCRVDPLSYCPDRSVSRAQMATFLVRAFGLEAADPAGFTDTSGNTHETNIDALAAAGVTAGCTTEPLSYCPAKPVSRAQMATFLARALGLIELPRASADTADTPDAGDEEPPDPNAFTTVSAGGNHACGLRANGTVICWGDNYFSQRIAPEGPYSAVRAAHFIRAGSAQTAPSNAGVRTPTTRKTSQARPTPPEVPSLR